MRLLTETNYLDYNRFILFYNELSSQYNVLEEYIDVGV